MSLVDDVSPFASHLFQYLWVLINANYQKLAVHLRFLVDDHHCNFEDTSLSLSMQNFESQKRITRVPTESGRMGQPYVLLGIVDFSKARTEKVSGELIL